MPTPPSSSNKEVVDSCNGYDLIFTSIEDFVVRNNDNIVKIYVEYQDPYDDDSMYFEIYPDAMIIQSAVDADEADALAYRMHEAADGLTNAAEAVRQFERTIADIIREGE